MAIARLWLAKARKRRSFWKFVAGIVQNNKVSQPTEHDRAVFSMCASVRVRLHSSKPMYDYREAVGVVAKLPPGAAKQAITGQFNPCDNVLCCLFFTVLWMSLLAPVDNDSSGNIWCLPRLGPQRGSIELR